MASIPPWLWWLQFGTWNIAAIPHDWAYIFGYLFRVDEGKLVQVQLTKKEADRFFADVNLTAKTSQWLVTLMYWAVRLFGRGIWTRLQKQEHHYQKPLWKLQAEFDHSATLATFQTAAVVNVK